MEKMESLNPLVLDPPCRDLYLDIPMEASCVLRVLHTSPLKVSSSRSSQCGQLKEGHVCFEES